MLIMIKKISVMLLVRRARRWGKDIENFELTELFRARDASCPKGKKMDKRYGGEEWTESS